ncbi:FecCD family ABC transporter permease [Lysinibacillus fusiformis]|uniref:FecCD family ABC transporter permease n=1 Tax=Lysinibacillus fusiformis TaxID=28031 RepID=UPI0008803E8C|nr:iron ABC transporter permease [Lysinibacillus fusiformis]SCX64740.1 iron complex transport system permease protein [Lysinibacillus fusiformis]SDB49028.1 iron complex transport system permease protein [Lysinibacillus fusiformis]SFI82784.1 iron complex transport system permease protein [Lysinibacillus fusiformis]SFT19333.1 iron complex transport system permease protein [Lysinibacillus fusiformis]
MKKIATAYVLTYTLLIISIWCGVAIGSVHIPIEVLWNQSVDETAANIFWKIRLPRVLLAGLVGASLAIAGAAFQGLLKNPLADPYTLGISSGASVGAVMTIFFNISIPVVGLYALPTFSMIGAIITMVIVMSFARVVDRSLKMETLILTGVIFSSFLGSLISLMIALSGEELRQVIGWLLGSVSMRGWPYVQMIIPFVIVGSLMLWTQRRELNVLLYGEERAKHLGVNVKKSKYLILVGGSMLTGAAVAVSGTIGFVGLVVPHMTRMIWGSDHRHLLPLSFFNGATLLIICDLVARTIILPRELPIGVITAFIGAPVFSYIFYKQRRGKGVRA